MLYVWYESHCRENNHLSRFFRTDAMKHKRLLSLARRCAETMTLPQQHPVKTRTCLESGSESGQSPRPWSGAGCGSLCTHSHCEQLSRPPHHPGFKSPPPGAPPVKSASGCQIWVLRGFLFAKGPSWVAAALAICSAAARCTAISGTQSGMMTMMTTAMMMEMKK